jgi:hypothetical protein
MKYLTYPLNCGIIKVAMDNSVRSSVGVGGKKDRLPYEPNKC